MPILPPNMEMPILYAVVGLLVLLRFDARRFGAAEYDDEDAPGGLRPWLSRLAWYAGGLLLIGVVYALYDRPLSVLHLTVGADRGGAILFGLLLGVLGTGVAVAYGLSRYDGLRLPPARRYPAAIVNSIGTAFLDEAVFRGIVLGLTLAAGWPLDLAVAFQAVLYGLATRLGSRGGQPGMLLLALAIGFVGAWATIETGGIGAAVLGHAVIRLAFFVVTGHVGVLRPNAQAQELAEVATEPPPEGWAVLADKTTGLDGGYR
jgi:membrane protease YdiL (CAAX protease family)